MEVAEPSLLWGDTLAPAASSLPHASRGRAAEASAVEQIAAWQTAGLRAVHIVGDGLSLLRHSPDSSLLCLAGS